jgi:hypothetical protein
MRKKSVSILYCITLIAIAFWAFDVRADQTYNNCIGCHGDFQANPYFSLKDGQTWADSLHNVHQSKVNKNCNFCHFGTSKTPVYLNKSNGVTGQAAIGCAGCHGRAEDKNASVPSGYGAGLRQHHWNAGVMDCSAVGCHFDANPANYKPVGENIVPLNYAPIALYTSKPTDPCNKDGKENFGGTTIGLDNDGDGLYDGNDPDCQTSVACTDNDKDGYGSNGASTCANGTKVDCNDNNAAINPGAVEICDGIDNNCSGQIDEGVMNTYYKDNDGDGYGTPSLTTQGCTQLAGYAPNNTDCNDSDPKEHPNQTWYQDADGDGYSSGNIIVQCARPTGYKIASELQATSGDCNDNSSAVKPGVAEICDGIDNNCNGTVDDGIASTPTTCGVGVCAATGQSTCQNGKMVNTCTAGTSQPEGPFGSTTCSDSLDNDCDGTTDAADASCMQACVPSTEVCDGKDNDCDGQIDEGLTSTPTTCGVGTCASAGTLSCAGGQMVDSCKAGTPSAEICDGKDNNCNGTVDDGIASTPTTCGVGVCAATGQSICQNGKMVNTCTAGTPQTEGSVGDPTCSDGLDNDCNGLTDSTDSKCASTVCIDKDGDGYGANGDPSCPNGMAVDCNDRKASVNPGAVEVCDGVDNNCDGQKDEGVMTTYYKDADRDGYGDLLISKQSCRKPSRYVSNNTDCKDSNIKIHPGTSEICDGKDNNCNGQIDEGVQQTFYMDADRDGYGNPSVSIQSCRAPEGYVKNNTDCSDINSTVHAGVAGICNNQGDNDNDNDNGENDDDDGDGDFIHNFTTGCISCHTPHNEITDCMSCHSGLKED